MSPRNFFFSSESVTAGHPDKLCDNVSDAILDACMAGDPKSRVACECATNTGFILVMGEITTKARFDYRDVTRETIKSIGYDRPEFGFDGNTCAVLISLDRQSSDIDGGVSTALEVRDQKIDDPYERLGAGDQGLMFGYACTETPEYMPLPISLAHGLTRKMAEVFKNGTLPWMRPDGKSQVCVEYIDGKPGRVHSILVSTQHSPDVTNTQIRKDLIDTVIKPTIPKQYWSDDIEIFTNPSGRFVIGGPVGDSGVTGRKIIVDTYGGYARHGGGAFSGKDCTKVDRSAAYAARWAAKNIVAAGIATDCEIQLAYAIGKAEPLSIYVDTFGTGNIPDTKILELINRNFDFRPAAIIDALNLRRPIYRQTAAYGHFGRPDLDLPWEKLNKVDILKDEAGIKAEA
ncbi:MAG: methionine adenosyltransferase [bacterium]|nr:methionine adenosyltransferase [bacterium]